MEKSIYTHRDETIAASKFIYDNLQYSFIGYKGDTNYYNVNGIVWEIWRFGTGNYPTTNGTSVQEFSL